MRVVAKRGRLSEAEALPTTNHVYPRFKVVGVVQGNMRPPANEKRLRVYTGAGPNTAESRDSRAFNGKPVIKISGDVRLVTEIVKLLSQDVELQVLKSDPELPWFTIRRN